MGTLHLQAQSITHQTLTIAGGYAEVGGYDLTVNGIMIGKGAGNVSSITGIGYFTLISNTTGNYNTARGGGALVSNKTG